MAENQSQDTVGLIDGPVEWAGALDLVVDDIGGVTARRLPNWTVAQFPDLTLDFISRMPSGVRLRFATDATSLSLDVMLTHFQVGTQPRRPARFDLVINGTLADQQATLVGTLITITGPRLGDLDVTPGDVTTIEFTDLAHGTKIVEVWLPQAAVVEVRALRTNAGANVDMAEAVSLRRWVHYGSSISHCMEAASPTATWPAVAARLAEVDLTSLGLAGQCMLDQFAARAIRDQPADCISLKMGINIVNGDTMRARTFGPAVHGFLDTIREGHPQTPIVVVSPIFCPSAEHSPGPTILGENGKFHTVPGLDELRETCLSLTAVRASLAAIVAARRDAGDMNLHYLDGLALFGEADAADLPDDLHPNADGYVRMGERFNALVFEPGGPLAAR